MLRFNHSLLHDKLVQRMVYILESLDNGQKLVSSKYLAEQLDCSIRTISNDITQLKAILPKNWNICSVKARGYLMIKPTNQSIGSIVNTLMTESIIYKIMLGIFNNKHFTLEKWSQILYCNKLTIKNNLK
ncbi:helix-turn-helix domain-containing protein, partial [Bacillus cereus]